jgi:TonB family protein
LDRDLTRAAAQGNEYTGSLNLTRTQARDLGAALGCEFYVLGDAQTVKRSPSTGEAYFEAYASLFLVSARTGNLVSWSRPAFRAETAEAAEKMLISELATADSANRLLTAMSRAHKDEVKWRAIVASSEAVIEEAAEGENIGDETFRLPRPFRRLRPKYTDEAAAGDAEATVDVLVDIDEKGEVTNAEIERWAGFGLDQSTLETVRQLHFFPGMRNGNPMSMRVLLRYNFRKSAKNNVSSPL